MISDEEILKNFKRLQQEINSIKAKLNDIEKSDKIELEIGMAELAEMIADKEE